MCDLEEIFQKVQADPDTQVESDWIENWLEGLGNSTEQYHYLENKTREVIEEEKNEILRELPIDIEKWRTSLSMYRVINDLQDLRLGNYIRWIRETPNGEFLLTNGGILVQIKFLKNGTYVVCKNGFKMMQYELEKCKTFQKITAEEWIFLMANDTNNTNNK